MTDTPQPVGEMTPEEAGIWPGGFDAEGGPPPLSPEDAAALADTPDEPVDFDTTGGAA